MPEPAQLAARAATTNKGKILYWLTTNVARRCTAIEGFYNTRRRVSEGLS